jgi:hypothetical protein
MSKKSPPPPPRRPDDDNSEKEEDLVTPMPSLSNVESGIYASGSLSAPSMTRRSTTVESIQAAEMASQFAIQVGDDEEDEEEDVKEDEEATETNSSKPPKVAMGMSVAMEPDEKAVAKAERDLALLGSPPSSSPQKVAVGMNVAMEPDEKAKAKAERDLALGVSPKIAVGMNVAMNPDEKAAARAERDTALAGQSSSGAAPRVAMGMNIALDGDEKAAAKAERGAPKVAVGMNVALDGNEKTGEKVPHGHGHQAASVPGVARMPPPEQNEDGEEKNASDLKSDIENQVPPSAAFEAEVVPNKDEIEERVQARLREEADELAKEIRGRVMGNTGMSSVRVPCIISFSLCPFGFILCLYFRLFANWISLFSPYVKQWWQLSLSNPTIQRSDKSNLQAQLDGGNVRGSGQLYGYHCVLL